MAVHKKKQIMKKSILILVILFTYFTMNGQDHFIVSLGFDPKLAISGAYEHDKSSVADIQMKFGTRLENGFEFGLQFETANLDPSYFSAGFFSNYNLTNKKESIIYSAGIELLMIDRGSNKVMTEKALDVVLAYGLNAEIRVRLINDLFIGFIFNATRRTDLVEMYNESVYFKTSGFVRFIYEFEQK